MTKIMLTLLGAVLCAVMVSGCGKSDAKDSQGGGRGGAGGARERVVTVTLATATTRDWSLVARAVGNLDADERVTIRNELAGVVREIPAREGSLVSRGDVLVQFDDEKLRLEVRRAEAKFEEMRANLLRRKPLFEEKIISETEMIEAESSFKAAEAELGLAKRRLADARVVAPIDGELGRRYVAVGDYAAVGAPLFDLVKVDVLKLNFNLPERYLPMVREGLEVRVTSPAYPDKQFAGKVDFIDPIVDVATRTVRLRARVENPDSYLRPNLFVNVEINVATIPNALVVPEEAIISNVGGFLVYVVDAESKAQARNVTLGERERGFVQIVEGLKAGERIVTQGHQFVHHGTKVAERAPAAAERK